MAELALERESQRRVKGPLIEPELLIDLIRCPTCGGSFDFTASAGAQCIHCGFAPDAADGVVDLVSPDRRSSERDFYDDYYGQFGVSAPSGDLSTLAATWTWPDAPWEMQRVWMRLGDLADKVILLLGNGESTNELFMLTQQPRLLIYSDLSPVGLRRLRRQLEWKDRERMCFVAIDAVELPLRDACIDVVYGFAFAHHLDDIRPLLRETARVLKPGGRCVFMDGGYSPIWQRLKLFWLRPLMWYSHRRDPRSPEDVRDTFAGGYREDWLAQQIRDVGGIPSFERVAFLYYFWKRASVSLFPGLFRWIPRHDRVSSSLLEVDRRLGRFGWYRQNMIRLVWGFEKPQIGPASLGAPTEGTR